MASALLTLCFLTGLALLAYGAWLAWHPAGFITAGVVLVLLPWLWVRGRWASSTG
jgi:predicted ABC-type exoprotein transport system permease subunit